MRRLAPLLIALTVSVPVCAAQDLSVPVTVAEPAGVARTMFPASGGIPFLPGTVKDVSELVLVDSAGKPVTAQFTKLAGYDDGSVQWALVDVVVDRLPANGEAKFTIRKGKTGLAEATPPLKIEETADAVTVDTGAVRFVVNKARFALFDEVTVGGRKVVAGGAVELAQCELAMQGLAPEYNRVVQYPAPKADGRTFAATAGKPARVSWEYRGPLRATLRIDGDYEGGGEPTLSYTTRITAWAGCGAVRVQHSIRNADPQEGSDAYIKRAAFTLKLAFDAKAQAHDPPGPIPVTTPPPPPPVDPAADPTTQPARKPRPGDYSAQPCDDWASGGDGSVGLMVQDRHSGGIYRGPGTYLRKAFDCGWSVSWPGLFVQSVDGRQAVVEVVSQGPKLEGKGTEKGALGFTQDGTFALADRSHKDSEVWFDFYAGTRDAAANAARAAACRSKLLVLAPGEWYSRTDTLGSGHFGTLADEIATYRQWGWKGWDDRSLYPSMAHQPFAFIPMEWIHDVSEDDAVEGYVLQFLRTGDRGFFDWAEAYTGFFRCHAIFRNDFGPRWGTPDRKTVRVDAQGNDPDTRKPPAPGQRVNRGFGFGWYGPHYYDWADSRMHGCHQYGRGIFDYYCLTGEVDALEAGLDLAEQMTAGYDRHKPGGSFTMGRSFGRALNTALRAWQVTRDPRYKAACDHYAAMILQASNWSPERKVYLQEIDSTWFPYFEWDWVRQRPNNKVYIVPPRILKYIADNGLDVRHSRDGAIATKGDDKWEVFVLTQIFELSECHQAMERYARVMDSGPMKDRLVQFTRGIIDHYWSEKCQFMRDRGYIGWPDKDKVMEPWQWMESHDNCPTDPCGVHSGYSTRYVADMCARAYSYSADRTFLDWAKKCWNRGNKRMYQRTEQNWTDDEVGQFAYVRGAHNDSLLECSARMFYEWARVK